MQEITLALKRIATEGDDSNFLIIEFGPSYYIQFAQNKGEKYCHCEAVSNHYISNEGRLTREQIDTLIKLGWSEAKGDQNHIMKLENHSEEDHQRITKLVIETAKIAYGCDDLVIGDLFLG